MTPERWSRLISVEPDQGLVRRAADRARCAALLRFAQVDRSRSILRWPALAAGGALCAAAWLALSMQPAAPSPAPDRQRTQVQFTLSDGTKVHWVISHDFSL